MTISSNVEQFAQFHKALAEPIRLRIMALLSHQESLCVCDLVQVLGLSQSTISRHLAYLRNNGLVTTWREGNWIHYALLRENPFFSVVEQALYELQQLCEVKNDLKTLKLYQLSPRRCDI